MTYKELFFSFEGRIDRATYWKVFSFMLVAFFILWALPIITEGFLNPEMQTMAKLINIVILVILSAMQYPVGVKRCHDINLSGWFQIISLISFVSLFWIIILGCIKGKEEENKYGLPPTK